MNQEKEPLYNPNEFDEVVQRYEEMIKLDKSYFFDVHEFENIIEHFINHSDLLSASKAVEYSIKQHPQSYILLLKQAQILIDLGKSAKALQILDKLELLENSNLEIYLSKGMAYNSLGDTSNAVNCFDLAIKNSESDISDILLNIAINFERTSNFKIAIEYLLKAYHIDYSNLSVIFDLAYCYEQINDFSQSLVYYQEYLDLDPFSETAWFNIAGVYSQSGSFEKAIDAFDYCIAINENYSLAYFNKGNAYANSENFIKAIECYNEFLYFEENHCETLCYIGECYERMNNYELALDYYNKVIKFNPDFSDAWFGKSVIFGYQNNYSESYQYIARAIELNPNNSEYYYSQAGLLLKLNLTDKAIDSYNIAIDLDPDDFESWLNLSDIYYKKNLLSKAIKILEDSYKYNSNNGLINYRLAAYNLLKSEINQAICYLRKGLMLDFNEYNEMLNYYPEAINIAEVKELLEHYKNYQK